MSYVHTLWKHCLSIATPSIGWFLGGFTLKFGHFPYLHSVHQSPHVPDSQTRLFPQAINSSLTDRLRNAANRFGRPKVDGLFSIGIMRRRMIECRRRPRRLRDNRLRSVKTKKPRHVRCLFWLIGIFIDFDTAKPVASMRPRCERIDEVLDEFYGIVPGKVANVKSQFVFSIAARYTLTMYSETECILNTYVWLLVYRCD